MNLTQFVNAVSSVLELHKELSESDQREAFQQAISPIFRQPGDSSTRFWKTAEKAYIGYAQTIASFYLSGQCDYSNGAQLVKARLVHKHLSILIDCWTSKKHDKHHVEDMIRQFKAQAHWFDRLENLVGRSMTNDDLEKKLQKEYKHPGGPHSKCHAIEAFGNGQSPNTENLESKIEELARLSRDRCN